MHQYAEQLSLQENMWGHLGKEIEARLVSSVATDLKLPVPRNQLINKRLKGGICYFIQLSTTSLNPLIFNDRTTVLREENCRYQRRC